MTWHQLVRRVQNRYQILQRGLRFFSEFIAAKAKRRQRHLIAVCMGLGVILSVCANPLGRVWVRVTKRAGLWVRIMSWRADHFLPRAS